MTIFPTNADLPPHNTTPSGLYRHYKGGWYSVTGTVRCSETLQNMTLYRALYGECAWWVRPTTMFNETGEFNGQQQGRFAQHDPAVVQPTDLPTARALIAHLAIVAEKTGIDLNSVLRPPPPEPTTCCARGCNGCVWEGFYAALNTWRNDVWALLIGRHSLV